MDDKALKAVGRQFMEMSVYNDNIITALEEARQIIANLQGHLLKCECECNANVVAELKKVMQPPKLSAVPNAPEEKPTRKRRSTKGK